MKLVFIAQGIALAKWRTPLFAEPVEAWKHGPVIRNLWKSTHHYGSRPIASRIRDEVFDCEPEIPDSDQETLELLAFVWQTCSKYSGAQLSNWTHEDGSPWSEIRKNNPADYNHICESKVGICLK